MFDTGHAEQHPVLRSGDLILAYQNPNRQRTYSRLWARVRAAKDPYTKMVALKKLRQKFPEQRRLSPEVRNMVRKTKWKIWAQMNPDRVKELRKSAYGRRKAEVIYHYSKGTMRCAIPGCGEWDLDELQVDHVNGDGHLHVWPKTGHRVSGNAIYKWLLQHKLPSGFQVLCRKHNVEKGPAPYTFVRQRAAQEGVRMALTSNPKELARAPAASNGGVVA